MKVGDPNENVRIDFFSSKIKRISNFLQVNKNILLKYFNKNIHRYTKIIALYILNG